MTFCPIDQATTRQESKTDLKGQLYLTHTSFTVFVIKVQPKEYSPYWMIPHLAIYIQLEVMTCHKPAVNVCLFTKYNDNLSLTFT